VVGNDRPTGCTPAIKQCLPFRFPTPPHRLRGGYAVEGNAFQLCITTLPFIEGQLATRRAFTARGMEASFSLSAHSRIRAVGTPAGPKQMQMARICSAAVFSL
jgi:hypothetical protein